MIFILILFLNLFLVGWSQPTPQILKISENQVVNVGDTVDLQCSVKDAREFPVAWLKLGLNPIDNDYISSGHSLIVRDDRFSLDYDEVREIYKIQIKNARESDSGRYQCQLLISATLKLTENLELKVNPLHKK